MSLYGRLYRQLLFAVYESWLCSRSRPRVPGDAPSPLAIEGVRM